MQTFKKLLFLLNSKERKSALLLFVMILIMAFLDLLGVASILPFMLVLTNPDLIETNLFLNSMFKASSIFGVRSDQNFLFVLGFVVFFLLVISLIFKAITTYMQLRFVQMRDYSISKRLIEGYLNQPYSWFLNRNSAEIGKTILSEVSGIIGNGIKPLIELIAKGVVAFSLIFLLVIADPKLALIVGLIISVSYLSIFYIIKNYLKLIGKKRLKNNQLRFISVSEAFGAIKEVKFGGIEKTFINRFSNSAKIYAKTQATAQVLAHIPRFFLEAISFGGILLLILYMMVKSGNFNNALPIISLYVFAGYRLMPALQQIYASFTSLVFVGPALDKLHDDIKKINSFSKNIQIQKLVSFNDAITLNNIEYNYPNSSKTALKNINLTIPAKSKVGFVGSTGSGKTTIVDIILGLLQAQRGTLEVDGQTITKQNIRSWQRCIGYVPQNIYLADESVASNIAFGLEERDINLQAVEKASKIAKLHNFVVEELPDKYQTIIGERGIRLSGGQRQRIGIARALYHNPKVLVFDEATSALDNQTEKLVMEATNNLNKEITIILIAHRLNTVKDCDIIYNLEKGKIIKKGSFEEIIKKNEEFELYN